MSAVWQILNHRTSLNLSSIIQARKSKNGRSILRYGTSVSSLSKIVTRISSIESVIRKVANVNGETVIYSGVEQNRSTRYTIAT